MNKTVYLKVKIKSLAEEARIIRKEENRCKDADFRSGLTNHRRVEVRREARATLIAYGYLRGHKYREVEPVTTRQGSDVALVMGKAKSMAQRYGGMEAKEGFDLWLKAA